MFKEWRVDRGGNQQVDLLIDKGIHSWFVIRNAVACFPLQLLSF